MTIRDPSWRYVPASQTNVSATWRRFGFKPTTQAERDSRQRRRITGTPVIEAPELAPVRPARLDLRLRALQGRR
jgi:hypothetical protein